MTLLFAALVLMACVVVSCGGGGGGSDEPSPTPTPAVTAKYLTEDEFAKSSWKGEFNGKELTLDVTGKTSMTLKYYVVKTVSKNTDPEYEQKTVSITYTFDAAKGVASGSGKVDGADQAYTATLTSKTAMKFTNGANGDVNLTKK